MRGIFRGIGKGNSFSWDDDVPFPRSHNSYPFTPARVAKDGIAASEGCLFWLNGTRCQLVDLKAGDKIEVSGNPAVEVRATRVV